MGKVFQYVVRVNGKEYNVEIESENEEIFLKSVTRAATSETQTRREESTQKAEPAPTAAGTSAPTTSSAPQSLLLQLRLVVQWWRLRYQVRFSESTCQREVR